LALAAEDQVEALMNFGWQIVDSITRKYVGVLEDLYVDAVTGISACAKATMSTPISVGENIALSRRIDKHWRLIGWGQIQAGKNLALSYE